MDISPGVCPEILRSAPWDVRRRDGRRDKDAGSR